MRVLISAITALLLAAPMAAHAQEAAPCAVNVQFGSYAMGIDRGALNRVTALLAKDRGVRAVGEQRWGREGEVTLCVRVRKASDMRRLFTRVRSVLPRDPRGPVTLTTRSGLRYQAGKL